MLLFQKEKEYLQPLPNLQVIESYQNHNRQTTVRKDSMISYKNRRYSVPPEYIGNPVSIQVTPDKLFIYYNMEIIAEHHLSSKRLNYQKEHYKNLLSYCVDDVNTVVEMAEDNLRQMDDFL